MGTPLCAMYLLALAVLSDGLSPVAAAARLLRAVSLLGTSDSPKLPDNISQAGRQAGNESGGQTSRGQQQRQAGN